MKEIQCKECGTTFQSEKPVGQRGRHPVRCTDCRQKSSYELYGKKKSNETQEDSQ